MRIAALPMYDLEELRGATDAFWAELARALRGLGVEGVPDRLTRDKSPEDVWSDGRLLFAQTCGYPLTHGLLGQVELVATPRYRAKGCAGSAYRSFIVASADSSARSLDDTLDGTCAVNQRTSHSGMNALFAAVSKLGARGFRAVRISGSHLSSMDMIARREADVAAIDCVTFALVERHRPALIRKLKVIGETDAAPALPFITRSAADAAHLRAALDSIPERTRRPLLIEGFDHLPAAAYDRILSMEAEAASVHRSV